MGFFPEIEITPTRGPSGRRVRRPDIGCVALRRPYRHRQFRPWVCRQHQDSAAVERAGLAGIHIFARDRAAFHADAFRKIRNGQLNRPVETAALGRDDNGRGSTGWNVHVRRNDGKLKVLRLPPRDQPVADVGLVDDQLRLPTLVTA